VLPKKLNAQYKYKTPTKTKHRFEISKFFQQKGLKATDPWIWGPGFREEEYFSPVSKDGDQTCQSNCDESPLPDSGQLVDSLNSCISNWSFKFAQISCGNIGFCGW